MAGSVNQQLWAELRDTIGRGGWYLLTGQEIQNDPMLRRRFELLGSWRHRMGEYLKIQNLDEVFSFEVLMVLTVYQRREVGTAQAADLRRSGVPPNIVELFGVRLGRVLNGTTMEDFSKVEDLMNNKTIQCRNCSGWGHTAKGCSNPTDRRGYLRNNPPKPKFKTPNGYWTSDLSLAGPPLPEEQRRPLRFGVKLPSAPSDPPYPARRPWVYPRARPQQLGQEETPSEEGGNLPQPPSGCRAPPSRRPWMHFSRRPQLLQQQQMEQNEVPSGGDEEDLQPPSGQDETTPSVGDQQGQGPMPVQPHPNEMEGKKAPSFRPLTCHSCEKGAAPLAFLDGETGRIVCNHHYCEETCAKANTDIPEKKKQSDVTVAVVRDMEKVATSSDHSILSEKSSPPSTIINKTSGRGYRRGLRLDQKERDSDLPLGFSISYEDLTSIGKRDMSTLPDFDLEDLNDEELEASLRVEDDLGNRIMDATVAKFLESNNIDIEEPVSFPQSKTLLDQNIQMTLSTLDLVIEHLITIPDEMMNTSDTTLSKDGALRRTLWSECRYSPNLRSGGRFWGTWYHAQLHKINVVADSDVEYYTTMQNAIFKYINSGQAQRFSYSLKPSKGEVILMEYIREGVYMCSRARVEAVFVYDSPEEVRVNVTFVDIGGRQELVDCNHCFFMPDALAKLPIWGLTVEFSGIQPGGIGQDTLARVPVYIDGSDKDCMFLDIFRKLTLQLKLENEVSSDMFHIFYRGILTFGNSKVSVNDLVANIIRDICTEEKRQIKVREILKKRSPRNEWKPRDDMFS